MTPGDPHATEPDRPDAASPAHPFPLVPPLQSTTTSRWFDGIPRTFADCFPNARGFKFGSLPETRLAQPKPTLTILWPPPDTAWHGNN